MNPGWSGKSHGVSLSTDVSKVGTKKASRVSMKVYGKYLAGKMPGLSPASGGTSARFSKVDVQS